ncbi:hypothetical protein FXO38_21702 [Capsicum annuum]|nr:hypothetical protein FXO37_24154 [Capsicum annuum]KAF3641276.1 hypothetical protein FXO38_21702 [Capsicum annuum]
MDQKGRFHDKDCWSDTILHLARSESNNEERGGGERWPKLVAIGLRPACRCSTPAGRDKNKERERTGDGLSDGAGPWCLMVVGGWPTGSYWWRHGADWGFAGLMVLSAGGQRRLL